MSKEKEFANAILHQPGFGKNNQYRVEFYDHSPVIVNAANHAAASILAKAFIIHKFGVGWGIRLIVSLKTKIAVPDELDRWEDQDAYGDNFNEEE